MKVYTMLFPCNMILFTITIIGASILFTGCQSKSQIENNNVLALKRIYEEGVNKKNLEVIEDFLTDNYIRHCQAMPAELQLIKGKKAMMDLFRGHFMAFPDWKEEIEIKAVDHDIIVYLSTGTGTQTGKIGDWPPLGNKCDLDHIIIHRFEDGKIAETWSSWDNLTLMGQLGHYPPKSHNQ